MRINLSSFDFEFFPSYYLSRKNGTSETFLGLGVASASKNFSLVPFSYFGKTLGKLKITRGQIYPRIKMDKYENKILIFTLFHSRLVPNNFTEQLSKSNARNSGKT